MIKKTNNLGNILKPAKAYVMGSSNKFKSRADDFYVPIGKYGVVRQTNIPTNTKLYIVDSNEKSEAARLGYLEKAKIAEEQGDKVKADYPRKSKEAYAKALQYRQYAEGYEKEKYDITKLTSSEHLSLGLLDAVNKGDEQRFTSYFNTVLYLSRRNYIKTSRTLTLLPWLFMYNENFIEGGNEEPFTIVDGRNNYGSASAADADIDLIAGLIIAAEKGWGGRQLRDFIQLYTKQFLVHVVKDYHYFEGTGKTEEIKVFSLISSGSYIKSEEREKNGKSQFWNLFYPSYIHLDNLKLIRDYFEQDQKRNDNKDGSFYFYYSFDKLIKDSEKILKAFRQTNGYKKGTPSEAVKVYVDEKGGFEFEEYKPFNQADYDRLAWALDGNHDSSKMVQKYQQERDSYYALLSEIVPVKMPEIKPEDGFRFDDIYPDFHIKRPETWTKENIFGWVKRYSDDLVKHIGFSRYTPRLGFEWDTFNERNTKGGAPNEYSFHYAEKTDGKQVLGGKNDPWFEYTNHFNFAEHNSKDRSFVDACIQVYEDSFTEILVKGDHYPNVENKLEQYLFVLQHMKGKPEKVLKVYLDKLIAIAPNSMDTSNQLLKALYMQKILIWHVLDDNDRESLKKLAPLFGLDSVLAFVQDKFENVGTMYLYKGPEHVQLFIEGYENSYSTFVDVNTATVDFSDLVDTFFTMPDSLKGPLHKNSTDKINEVIFKSTVPRKLGHYIVVEILKRDIIKLLNNYTNAIDKTEFFNIVGNNSKMLSKYCIPSQYDPTKTFWRFKNDAAKLIAQDSQLTQVQKKSLIKLLKMSLKPIDIKDELDKYLDRIPADFRAIAMMFIMSIAELDYDLKTSLIESRLNKLKDDIKVTYIQDYVALYKTYQIAVFRRFINTASAVSSKVADAKNNANPKKVRQDLIKLAQTYYALTEIVFKSGNGASHEFYSKHDKKLLTLFSDKFNSELLKNFRESFVKQYMDYAGQTINFAYWMRRTLDLKYSNRRDATTKILEKISIDLLEKTKESRKDYANFMFFNVVATKIELDMFLQTGKRKLDIKKVKKLLARVKKIKDKARREREFIIYSEAVTVEFCLRWNFQELKGDTTIFGTLEEVKNDPYMKIYNIDGNMFFDYIYNYLDKSDQLYKGEY